MRTTHPLLSMYFCYISSPIGQLKAIATDKGLSKILWEHQEIPKLENYTLKEDYPHLKNVKSQLEEYFKGKRLRFNLPLDIQGTEFQKKAWAILREIPFGQTISYKKQAESLGDAKKAQAVGTANAKNPVPIIIPCHRVIAIDGKLSGFTGGLECKKYLIDHEIKMKAMT